MARHVPNPLTKKSLSSLASSDWLAIAQSNLAAAKLLATSPSPQPHEAVYLAGFAVEVALKGKSVQENVATIDIHDLEELLVRSQVLRTARAATVPPPVQTKLGFSPTYYSDLFLYLNSQWNNELRYEVATITPNAAQEFVGAAEEWVNWLWTA